MQLPLIESETLFVEIESAAEVTIELHALAVSSWNCNLKNEEVLAMEKQAASVRLMMTVTGRVRPVAGGGKAGG